MWCCDCGVEQGGHFKFPKRLVCAPLPLVGLAEQLMQVVGAFVDSHQVAQLSDGVIKPIGAHVVDGVGHQPLECAALLDTILGIRSAVSARHR